jgi:hypothetical protein
VVAEEPAQLALPVQPQRVTGLHLLAEQR